MNLNLHKTFRLASGAAWHLLHLRPDGSFFARCVASSPALTARIGQYGVVRVEGGTEVVRRNDVAIPLPFMGTLEDACGSMGVMCSHDSPVRRNLVGYDVVTRANVRIARREILAKHAIMPCLFCGTLPPDDVGKGTGPGVENEDGPATERAA